ncbi:MAG: Rieske 2Fe-2S domain-containing protein [Ahrensia sp.]|nr:Rieske 2Fe-2S domain-containing protein [Ahrensia sp.]
MDHETQVELLDEILGLRRERSAYLDETVTHSPVNRYLDEQRFSDERAQIFRKQPLLIAHSSELVEDGGFLSRDICGAPILLTRDRSGEAHAFFNVCRHRGARLVEAEEGCKHRFSCPYHAWTWDNTGRLIAIPHKDQGFPDLDKGDYGLKRIALKESQGWLWVRLDGDGNDDEALSNHIAELADDLNWLQMGDLTVHAVHERVWNCNWKIVVEGGLESYHFRVAHAKTIGALFHDNLSTYRAFGPHIRSILARTSVDDLVEIPRKQWRIRDHANVLYTLFPNSAWLVQSDHVVLIQFAPETVSQTRIRCVTLRPKQNEALTENQQSYWDKNHALTVKTLAEDFELGEKIQAGLDLGVNDVLTFGRYEGALDLFNRTVDEHLRASGPA